MKNKKRYPRVLIIYHNCINRADQHGVSIRGWFADWPTDHLAQIYSGGESGQERFCGDTFKLGPNERWFGKLFFWLKNSSRGKVSLRVVQYEKRQVQEGASTCLDLSKRAMGRLLLNSGLWELLFSPKLSSELTQWVQAFRPEIIYCQGYTLGFTWLPLMLQKKFDLPICFQTGDDWPMNLYSVSPLSMIMSQVAQRSARRL